LVFLVDKYKADRTHKGSGNDKKRVLQLQEEDLARKDMECEVPDEIEILPDNHVNCNPTEEELDSFDSIFLSSSSAADPDSTPDIESEDDNQKDENGTEGMEGLYKEMLK
jgi:hypothetical protein